MSSTRLLTAGFLIAGAFSVAAAPAVAAVPPTVSALSKRQGGASDTNADVPWVVGVVATQAPLAPAALLGLRPDEVLHVDARDPAHVDVVAQALQRWGSPVVLVIADTPEDGRILQKSLLEQCRPLREALGQGGTFLELVTVSGASGTFTFRGPHPEAADILQAESAKAIEPPAEPAPAADEGEAVLAAGMMGIEAIASLPAPVVTVPQTTAAPALAATPASGSGGNLAFALSGLMLAVGVVVWTNRARLFPGGLPAMGAWVPLGPSRPQKPISATPAPSRAGPPFQSSNARLSAAVNRLCDKLQQGTTNP